MTSLSILAFEPFDAGSHRAVRESISRHSRHEWRWFTRPGRSWKWRMRLAALEMVGEARHAGALDDRPDVIFTTSLLSAADLRAALPAPLRDVPLVLYMHENQVAYPYRPAGEVERERDSHFALTNLASLLTADRVLWNSAWNRDSFLSGIVDLLRHAPDAALGDVARTIEARSAVAWPPVEPPPPGIVDLDRVLHNPPAVVWPHRWEHDKGPDRLLALAREKTGRSLEWTILGERFTEAPREFDELSSHLGPRLRHIGHEPDRKAYWRRLAESDWVLSTARHEFFGIAVVEALLAGCLPWLPDALSYPELLPAGALPLTPKCPPDDVRAMREAIVDHLRPAVAPAAVARIDDELGTVAAFPADG